MIIPIMRGSSPRRRDDNIPSIPRQLASRRRTYGAKVVRVGVRLRVAPVHARRRGRGRLECWSFLPQIALPPSPLCLRPRAALALMSRLALEMSRLARNRHRSELRCHELKRRLRARAGSARSGAIKPRAAGAPPVAGVCDRTRAHDKVPSSEALAQLAARTSQNQSQPRRSCKIALGDSLPPKKLAIKTLRLGST